MDSKYPASLERFTKLDKQAYSYSNFFKTTDFSYKDRQSLDKSFDLLGSAGGAGFYDNIISGTVPDRFMDASEDNLPPAEGKVSAFNGASEQQMHQWY